MSTTTNFDEWIAQIDLDDYEEIDSLYRSVNEVTSYGLFSTQRTKNEGYIVKSKWGENSLLLASEKARASFLRKIENEYCDGNEEGWYAFKKAMEKDD